MARSASGVMRTLVSPDTHVIPGYDYSGDPTAPGPGAVPIISIAPARHFGHNEVFSDNDPMDGGYSTGSNPGITGHDTSPAGDSKPSDQPKHLPHDLEYHPYGRVFEKADQALAELIAQYGGEVAIQNTPEPGYL